MENGRYWPYGWDTETQKLFVTLRPIGVGILKCILRIVLNIMKLMYAIQIYKSMFPIKMINNINNLYTGFHKSFPIYFCLWGKFFKANFI